MIDFKVTDHFSIKRDRQPHDDLIACSCCGELLITPIFWYHMGQVEVLRLECGFGLRMTCGHRCESNNRAVGGAPSSVHLEFATDLQPWDRDPEKLVALQEIATDMNFAGIGLYNTFVHLDSRNVIDMPSPARWDYRT